MKIIKKWFKELKLKRFKKRKLRLARVSGEKTYQIHFSFLLLDENKTHKIENLEIFIPAKSAYDAKNNLVEFLRSKVGFELHDIGIVDGGEHDIEIE